MIGIGEVLDDPNFTDPVTRKRPTGAFDGSGVFLASGYTDTAIQASVQPADAKEIESLPEGERGSGAVYAVFSKTELRMSDGETYDADLIQRADGTLLRVVGQEDWSHAGYYKVLAVEQVT